MIYSHEVELMCPVAKGAKHEPAPIPEADIVSSIMPTIGNNGCCADGISFF